MFSIKQHPGRYAASLAAVLAIAGGIFITGPAFAAHTPARAAAASADLKASTVDGASSTSGGTISTLGGSTSTSGPTQRLQEGTPPKRIVLPPGTNPCIFIGCGPMISAYWQYNEYGRGTITVYGEDFSGGDTVNVTIDGPTNYFQGSTTASGPKFFGDFSIPDSGVECNPYSATVTATDAQTGASKSTSVTMPCP
jgi:hypothetical protein